MKSKKRLLIRILAIAVVIGVAVTMFIIGRGHTVYFDNKDLEADGTEYKSYYQIEVFVDDVSVCKLRSGERGMVSTMGQDFTMVLHITPEKDGKKVGSAVTLKLPYNMDGIILNLPAMLGGASEDVYLEEFIPAPVEEEETEDVIVTDEFAMPTDE
ncbi:MAG: DUF6672 family protein [Blautia sp.]|nr:DUF6672 family protein [Blautia sp.]